MLKDGVSTKEKEMFLKKYHLQTVLQPTIYCWMINVLGFTYCDCQKTYYVDGHEREDAVLYWNQFCKRYLTEYGAPMHVLDTAKNGPCQLMSWTQKSDADTTTTLRITLQCANITLMQFQMMII